MLQDQYEARGSSGANGHRSAYVRPLLFRGYNTLGVDGRGCPVDAIVGAAKQMHTVVAAQCTGCELCIAPCPVDCIRMEAIQETVDTWKWKYPVIKLRQAA